MVTTVASTSKKGLQVNSNMKFNSKPNDEFISSIDNEFNFLVVEYGFERIIEAPFLTYRNGNLGVFVDISRQETVPPYIQVGYFCKEYPSLWKLDKQCSLLSFIELKKPQINTDTMLRKLNRMKPIDLFKEAATLLKEFIGDILSKGPEALEEVTRFEHKKYLTRTDANINEDFERTISTALERFKERDFEAVVFHLSEHENILSPQVLAIFKYAKEFMKSPSTDQPLTKEEIALLKPVEHPMPKTIYIQYFAILREQRGVSEETFTTNLKTAQELYAQIDSLYNFSLSPDVVRVAINNEFCPWETPIKSGDKIVFIPPVAGG